MGLENPSIINNLFRFNIIGIVMKSFMGRITTKCHKVFWAIIISNFVNMMTCFRKFKVATNLLFYNKSMLSNIIMFNKRIIRFINKNVSFVFGFTTNPTGIFRFHHRWSFSTLKGCFSTFYCCVIAFTRTIFSFVKRRAYIKCFITNTTNLLNFIFICWIILTNKLISIVRRKIATFKRAIFSSLNLRGLYFNIFSTIETLFNNHVLYNNTDYKKSQGQIRRFAWDS